MQQITNTVLMVKPFNFRLNEQTSINNHYQKKIANTLEATINKNAQKEFDNFVLLLKNNGVQVIVVNDTDEFNTPDAIFANNWISFHQNGTVAIYPLFAENRRLERREDVLEIVEKEGFLINDVIDYSEAENEGIFLEGTGSMVLDRVNRKAYCSLSERTDEELFIEFCEDFEYTPVIFNANQTINNKREAIYHTNVMLCVGTTFAVVCLTAIDDKKERKNVVKHLKEDGKKIIEITEEQLTNFAGNMLQVLGNNNESFLVMSSAALNSLTDSQKAKINNHCKIIATPLTTIETCGGGSARCMLTEIFLPQK